MESIGLVGSLALWLGAAVLVVAAQWRTRGVGAGLMIAYLLNLATIHWLGAAIYLFPWYSNYSPSIVEVGFNQSVWAIVGFATGSTAAVVLAPRLSTAMPWMGRRRIARAPEAREFVVRYVTVGLLFSFVLLPLIAGAPTLTAIVSVGRSLIAAGLGVACWEAWRRQSRILFAWIGAALCLPFQTIITEGFLGFGATTAVAIGALLATFYRPRWKLVLFGLVLAYLGLSFYVAYMRDRDDIREVVWGGQSLADRVERLYVTVRTSEWFNPYDNDQLTEIDRRLNQNYLVGAAVDFLDPRPADFARGETLWDAILALIPRALWADKPVVAGSTDLVTRFTGIEFAEGTSVGIGQVMEFYVNFGSVGVVLGFGVLGWLLSVIDGTAGRKLANGDWPGFALWYLPGLAFLQVGGSLVEVTASVAASLVAALAVNWVLFRRSRSEGRFGSRLPAR